MRSREQIQAESADLREAAINEEMSDYYGHRQLTLIQELLLDIRDLLAKEK